MRGRLPVDQFLRFKPESDLALSALDGIGAVHDVAASLQAEVATNRAWLRVLRVRLAEHDAARLDGVQARPDHGNHWTRGHVGDEAWEERTRRQVLVVLSQERLTWLFIQ